MGLIQAFLRMLNRSLEWLFGGAGTHRQAFDMMARLERSYPAASLIVGLAFLPGLVHYDWKPAIPLIGTAVGYSLALTWPAKSRYPYLAATVSWLLGLACSMVAARLAGPPYAFLWVGAAISLPYIAVIWPARLSVAATTVLLITMGAVATLWVPERVSEQPPALIGPLIGLIGTVVMIAVVREVDRRNREAVLTDVLTGLGNRAAIDLYRRELVESATSVNTPIAMVVFDLDHFKALNDELGHAAGDEALKATATALERTIPSGAGVFRYGGEEFVVLLPRLDQAAAVEAAERLRAAVAELEVEGRGLTVSGGLVLDRISPDLDLSAMFQRADAALYDAKHQGRNRVLVGLPQVTTPRRQHMTVGQHAEAGDDGARRSLKFVQTRLERDHLRVMWEELRGPGQTRLGNIGLVIVSLAGAYWLGWIPVALAVFSAIVLDPAVRRNQALSLGVRGRELGLFWESIFGITMIGLAVAGAKIEALYLLPLVIIPAFPSIVAYRPVGAIVTGVYASAVVVLTGCLTAWDTISENPLIISLPVGFIGTVTVVGMAIVSSTMQNAAAANIDPLTGALNRGALEARVAELSRIDASSYEPVTLIVADLDHFKQINDTYGHEAGDEVLVDVARRLQQELRLVDVLYRVGGEEFVVLLPRTGRPEAQQIAERLREAVSEHPCGGRPLTVSLGLTSSGVDDTFQYAPAFDRADAALLEAKEHGRNRVVVAEPPLKFLVERSIRRGMTRFLSLSAAVFALLIAAFLPTPAQAEGGDIATCVVKDNGTVWCWGWISGETMPTSTPVQISGISDAKSVSGPSATHCALRKTGAVACWGSNYNGQLGNGTNSFSSSPVEVSGLSDAIAVDTGSGSSCAVRVTGAVVCWGQNSNGQLGDGSTTNSNVPVSVVGLSGADDSSRALAVSVSESHACALMLAGSVKCWGSNSSGQLGDGTTDNSPTPVSVSALGDVTQIEAGVEGTCALRGDATVSCWGTNMIGLLGDGSSDPGSNLPVQVSGISTAVSISAPGYQRCAVLADGSLKCWGAIDLALAMTGDMSGAAFTPVPIAGITDAAYVLDGFYATCVVRLNGKAACLGLGVFGALGNGRPTLQAGPELPVQGLTDATDVQLGELFSCALRATKQISCWGVGPFGPGATSEKRVSATPQSVPDANDATSFSTGGEHGCAVITGGTVKCLGSNSYGQLGDGTTSDSFLAAVDVDGLTDAVAVAAGRSHSCALRTGGTVECWGYNWSGQLGDGTNDASSTPKAVSGLTDVSAVAAGGDTTCAIEDGGVWCWGELNDSNNTRSNEPEAVAGISTATKVAVGRSHACAVLADETAVCWGRNSGGKLGDGTAVDSATPVAVDGVTGVASIDAGESETCAVLNSGGVDCWGELTQRAHGGGETPAIYPVPGVSSATNVSVGAMATCARLADSTATCWGADYYGIAVFGDGEGPVGHGPQPTPHDVVGLTGVWTGHGNTDDDQPEDEDEGSDDDAVVDETPPVKTTPVDPPTILPPVKPIASVRFIGRKVIFTNYPVAATSKKKCPASVRVSVAVGKSLKKLKVLRVRRVAGACQVTGTVTLSSKVAKPRTLKIRLSGKSVRTRTVRVAKTVS